MISIIVCSVNEKYRENFLISVRNTVNVEHEIICIDNRVEKLSIASAYNKGARDAKYDILVFVHEDVIFRTNNWGGKLVQWFEKLENPGVLGMAANTYIPISPSGWWLPENKYLRIHYIQSSKISESHLVQVNAEKESPAFVLDGFFLAIKKQPFEQRLFDEKIPGFHGYDLSLSLRTSMSLQNYFIPDIIIEHLSGGTPDSAWVRSLITIYDKLYRELPQKKTVDKKLEIQCFGFFLENLKTLKSTRLYKIKTGLKYFRKVFLKVPAFRLVYLLIRFSGQTILNK